jgi:ribose transport system substrate-binding protein
MRSKPRKLAPGRRWAFTFALLIVVAMLTGLAAGCGGNDGNKTTTGTSSACDLDYVTKQIDDRKGVADWVYPGDPFDARKAAGKTIFSIQENSTNPFTNTIVAGMKDVATRTG